jgi:hypothetical protein
MLTLKHGEDYDQGGLVCQRGLLLFNRERVTMFGQTRSDKLETLSPK